MDFLSKTQWWKKHSEKILRLPIMEDIINKYCLVQNVAQLFCFTLLQSWASGHTNIQCWWNKIVQRLCLYRLQGRSSSSRVCKNSCWSKKKYLYDVWYTIQYFHVCAHSRSRGKISLQLFIFVKGKNLAGCDFFGQTSCHLTSKGIGELKKMICKLWPQKVVS